MGVFMSRGISAFLLLVFFMIGSGSVQGQISITGTVAMADGSLPANPVQVQLKCHGSVVQSAYTGPEGRFTFTVTERTGSSRSGPGAKSTHRGAGGFDASIGGPAIPADVDGRGQAGNIAFRRTDLSHCQCEATLAGHESNPVVLGVRSRFDNPDLGIIYLYPLGTIKGTTVSVTTAQAPKKAMDAYKKAQKEGSKEKVNYSKVEKNLQNAVEVYPEFAEAWQFLGETYLMEGKETEARDAFRRAIESDPQYLPPYSTLGELELRANNIEEAARLTGQAIELNPYAITSQYFHAISQYYLGNLEKAEESIQKVHESGEASQYPASHRLLGSIYSERGKYADAAAEFRLFLETGPMENDAEEVRKILDEWTKLGLI